MNSYKTHYNKFDETNKNLIDNAIETVLEWAENCVPIKIEFLDPVKEINSILNTEKLEDKNCLVFEKNYEYKNKFYDTNRKLNKLFDEQVLAKHKKSLIQSKRTNVYNILYSYYLNGLDPNLSYSNEEDEHPFLKLIKKNKNNKSFWGENGIGRWLLSNYLKNHLITSHYKVEIREKEINVNTKHNVKNQAVVLLTSLIENDLIPDKIHENSNLFGELSIPLDLFVYTLLMSRENKKYEKTLDWLIENNKNLILAWSKIAPTMIENISDSVTIPAKSYKNQDKEISPYIIDLTKKVNQEGIEKVYKETKEFLDLKKTEMYKDTTRTGKEKLLTTTIFDEISHLMNVNLEIKTISAYAFTSHPLKSFFDWQWKPSFFKKFEELGVFEKNSYFKFNLPKYHSMNDEGYYDIIRNKLISGEILGCDEYVKGKYYKQTEISKFSALIPDKFEMKFVSEEQNYPNQTLSSFLKLISDLKAYNGFEKNFFDPWNPLFEEQIKDYLIDEKKFSSLHSGEKCYVLAVNMALSKVDLLYTGNHKVRDFQKVKEKETYLFETILSNYNSNIQPVLYFLPWIVAKKTNGFDLPLNPNQKRITEKTIKISQFISRYISTEVMEKLQLLYFSSSKSDETLNNANDNLDIEKTKVKKKVQRF